MNYLKIEGAYKSYQYRHYVMNLSVKCSMDYLDKTKVPEYIIIIKIICTHFDIAKGENVKELKYILNCFAPDTKAKPLLTGVAYGSHKRKTNGYSITLKNEEAYAMLDHLSTHLLPYLSRIALTGEPHLKGKKWCWSGAIDNIRTEIGKRLSYFGRLEQINFKMEAVWTLPYSAVFPLLMWLTTPAGKFKEVFERNKKRFDYSKMGPWNQFFYVNTFEDENPPKGTEKD